MKIATRLKHLRDGSKVLSFAIQMSKKELDGALMSSSMPQYVSLEHLMEKARNQEMDLFFCFLRILIDDVRLWSSGDQKLIAIRQKQALARIRK